MELSRDARLHKSSFITRIKRFRNAEDDIKEGQETAQPQPIPEALLQLSTVAM